MVDIHSHILPELDDGSRSLDESVEMLRIAVESGTTDIAATPHANVEYRFDPDVVERKIEELKAAAGAAPRIHRGCDFHLSYDNIQDAIANPAKYTINGKRYLLVEFSDLVIFNNTSEVFGRLLEARMVPIITHPERNMLLQQRMEQLRAWAESGCLLQVTAQSLLDRFGRRARSFALDLMRNGLVHVIASDAHDALDRTPRMDEAFEFVAREFTPQHAETLFIANPQAVLAGEPIERSLPPEQARRKWYQFWG